MANGGRNHRQPHAHPRAGFDVPHAIRILRHIVRVVHALVGALHREPGLVGRQVQVARRIAHAQPVVQPARPVLADDEVLLLRHFLGDDGHRNVRLVVVGRPPAEG